MRKAILSLAACALISGCAAPAQTAQQTSDDTQDDQDLAAFSTYLSARFAEGEHDMPLAARYYSQSLKDNPENGAVLSMAFFYATTSGDVEGAGKYANLVVANTPDDRAARLALAIVAFKHHDYAEARKQLNLSSKGPFAALTVPLFDGWAAAAMNNPADAAADMRRLQTQGGAEGVSAFHSALVNDFLAKRDLAEASYKVAITLNPLSPRVVEAYGNFLERGDDPAAAKAFYEKLAGTPTLSPVVKAGLARIAANKKPEPMIRSAEDGATEALFGIAASLSDQASADISVLYLRMALYLRPDLALAQVLLANRFETMKEYQEAEAIYAKIDTASPYHRMAAVQAAVDRAQLGQKDQGVRELKSLVAASPDDSEIWIALGDAYRDMDKYDEATDAYNQAEKTLGVPAKRDWPLFYARALVEDKAHHWEKAETDIDTALRLSPDQPELLNYLGYSWVDQGRNVPKALIMLEKARTLRPYDGYIVDSVGWAYYRLGRYDEAARTLQAAILLVPGDPTVNDHLGDALWKDGQKIDARFQWYHALTFSADDSEKAVIERKLKTGPTGS